jgi:exo-poly-alpha-galacturonosidase
MLSRRPYPARAHRAGPQRLRHEFPTFLIVPMSSIPVPVWFTFALGLCSFWFGGCASGSSSASTGFGSFRLIAAPQTLRSDEVTLVWDRPAGRSGDAFKVLRDGVVVASTAKTHFTASGLTPEREYEFTVRTSDAGRPALASNPLAVRMLAKEPVVSVVEHGAVGDGKTLDTRALQAAIDACPKGGVVRIPEGTFLSGALYLKSDMTLEIAKGGVLKGTSDPKDYLPFNRNRFEGWEMETHASLLNAGRLDRAGPANVRNLSIRGEGVISGGGRKLSDAIIKQYAKPLDGLRARGRLILLMNAENVEVSGLTLEEPQCWTLHYIYSANVSLHGLTIRSTVHNGDGIDPDSSVNSLIFNCTFDTGDDCIAIKSGKNPEGDVVNRPTIGVRVFDCDFIRGHGISIGSEMSGGVRDVLVEDCVAGALMHGMQIKGTKERGGFVENVTVRNCDLQQITIYTELPYNNDGKGAPAQPFFRNFSFTDIDLTKADPKKPAIVVNGFPAEGHRTRNVRFENIKLPAGALVKIDRAEDLALIGIQTADGRAPNYEITRSERVTY